MIAKRYLISMLKQNNRQKFIYFYVKNKLYWYDPSARRGRARMVVGLTSTYAISAYHH
jgi:hypothetical protein